MTKRLVTFAYSKFAVWHVFAFILGIFTINVVLIINGDKNETHELAWPLLSVLIIYSIYFILRILISTIQNKSILTLDEEKIYHRKSNTIVYWLNVENVSWYHFNRSNYLKLELKENKGSFKIETNFFAADDDVILKAVQSYFIEIKSRR
jgi:hypothetical protein